MRESEPRPTPNMLDHALKYAARGWNVFALAKNGKIPIAGSHGLKDGTTDPILIEAMWASSPEANIGLKTGKESGIIIVDIDPRNNGNENLEELQKRYDKLPSTLLSRTPRGGTHRYFRHPLDGQSYGNAIELDKLSGIDVRGDNGYAVLPPSRINKLSYKWVRSEFPIAPTPTWLLALIKKDQKEAIPQQERNYSPNGEKWLSEALSRATHGNRNGVGFWLSLQLRDDGISQAEAEQILLAYSEKVPQGDQPYKTNEAIASVRSAYRRQARPPARRR